MTWLVVNHMASRSAGLGYLVQYIVGRWRKRLLWLTNMAAGRGFVCRWSKEVRSTCGSGSAIWWSSGEAGQHYIVHHPDGNFWNGSVIWSAEPGMVRPPHALILRGYKRWAHWWMCPPPSRCVRCVLVVGTTRQPMRDPEFMVSLCQVECGVAMALPLQKPFNLWQNNFIIDHLKINHKIVSVTVLEQRHGLSVTNLKQSLWYFLTVHRLALSPRSPA